MTNVPIEIKIDNSPLTSHYIPRARVDAILDRAARCKLVYVLAGAGFGKTQAVYHYIQAQQDAVVRWLQLTESDNIGSRYWEHLTYNISFDNPDLAVRLREFGFPETSARFKQFVDILKSTEHRSLKTFLVLDDFHLIHSKQALTFAERCAYLQIPGACVIIISRKEPGINAVPLLSRGEVSIITEDDLRYTDNELADLLKQSGVEFHADDVPAFLDATEGWALAVKLLSLVLKRTPQDIGYALDVMRQNVFKLLEIEAFNDFPESTRKEMVKLTLIPDLHLKPREIENDSFFTEDASRLASFMWYDSLTGEYRFHPLYMEFLQSKQDILTDEERLDAYRWAAQRCFENNLYMDAMEYLSKSHQYDRMLELLLSYPFKLPYDACEHLLGVLEEIDTDGAGAATRSVLLLKNLFCPLFYIGMGNFEKARELSLSTIKKWGSSDEAIAPYLLYTAYSNLSYIETYTCTLTHEYKFAEHLKRAVEYFNASFVLPVKVEGPFGVADLRAFACLVGEGAALSEFDLFVESARDAALYIDQTYHSMYAGYDELAAGELAFFMNQLDAARININNAVIKAREKKQYSIEMMAQYYLLRMAIHEGDGRLTNEMLRQLNAHLGNADFWNRQLLYDLFAGSFYTHIGLNDMVPSWLALEEKEEVSGIRIPVRELIVGVRYYFAHGMYKQALALLINSSPREPLERFHFGELIFSLLFAVARLNTGDAAGAAADFNKAYGLSLGGVFIMPFIELGKTFRPLAAAVSSQKSLGIPPEWLKSTGRKASIYAKKTAVIMRMIKRERQEDEIATLSEREMKVLKDLSHGLSRDEISAHQYLSRNTVDKVLQSVFIKLNARNSSDALRIAMEHKLIN